MVHFIVLCILPGRLEVEGAPKVSMEAGKEAARHHNFREFEIQEDAFREVRRRQQDGLWPENFSFGLCEATAR